MTPFADADTLSQVLSGPSLAVQVDGLRFPNPFVIGSGPPGTNYTARPAAVRLLLQTLALTRSHRS